MGITGWEAAKVLRLRKAFKCDDQLLTLKFVLSVTYDVT